MKYFLDKYIIKYLILEFVILFFLCKNEGIKSNETAMKKRVKERYIREYKRFSRCKQIFGTDFYRSFINQKASKDVFINVYTMKHFDRLVPLGSGSGPQRQIERHTRSLAGLTNGVIHFLNAKTYGKSEMDVR